MNSKILNPIVALAGLLIIFMITIFGFDLAKNLKTYSALNSERAKIQSQIKTWQSITEKFKGYKDGYLQLAVLEYRLGEFEKSKTYLDKALYLDPTYKEALELQKKLKNY
ncbi:MAG: hypothetical protein A2W22_00760 [Candidatus Levybacteria bacterium RBG_16_35_11]|nr:MAG: hypothetical protein A2W22_00760 [Candidatus Levybacteria bacterium RBG_16_35_11]